MKEIKRKKGESFEALMRRARTDWRRCGIITEIKRRKHFTPKRSKNVVQAQAVSKAQKKSKEAYLIKIGKMPSPDDRFNNFRRRR